MERRLDVFMLRTPNGEYRATARVASSADGIEINMRGGGADIENAKMYLLTDGGARIINNNRSPNGNCVIYGVAVLESGGSCVCSAGKPGYEDEFFRALAVLKQTLIEKSTAAPQQVRPQDVTPTRVMPSQVTPRDVTPSRVIPLPVTPLMSDDAPGREEIDEHENYSDYDEDLYATNIEPEPDGTIIAPSRTYNEILGYDSDYEQPQFNWADDNSGSSDIEYRDTSDDESYVESTNASNNGGYTENRNASNNGGYAENRNASNDSGYIEDRNASERKIRSERNNAGSGSSLAGGQGFSTRERCENPFQGQFAGSSWEKVSRINSSGYYYEGKMKRGDDAFIITAVPGVYTPIPPANLIGFSKYIRTHSGGFWVRTMKR